LKGGLIFCESLLRFATFMLLGNDSHASLSLSNTPTTKLTHTLSLFSNKNLPPHPRDAISSKICPCLAQVSLSYSSIHPYLSPTLE
jgi:hypothetical protein